MKNKTNKANGYECVKCETGETDKHGMLCSKNKHSFVINLKEDQAVLINGEGWVIKKGKLNHRSVLGLTQDEFIKKYS